jgi:hypothetical protein
MSAFVDILPIFLLAQRNEIAAEHFLTRDLNLFLLGVHKVYPCPIAMKDISTIS